VKAKDTAALSDISFFLQLAAGGASVDMKKVTFTVSTAKELKTYEFNGITDKWYENGVEQNGGEGTNKMLDKFEMVKITIPKNADGFPSITPNDRFSVEVKPDIGAALPINRIAPSDFQANYNYEVY